MPEKPFPPFPSSFWAGVAIFVIPALFLITSKPLGPYAFPNPIVFYSISFFMVIVIIGIIGWSNLVEWLGFDVTQPGETILQVWWRYPLLIIIGLAVGFGVYKLSNLSLTLYPFPMDLAFAQFLVSSPLFFNSLHFGIVAFFEEILRVAGSMIFANWLAKRLKQDIAIVGGIFLGSIFFILLHLVAWSFTPNILNYIYGILVVMVFTLAGYALKTREIFRRRAFKEFSIIPGIFGHWIYDLSLALKLMVLL